MAERFTVLPSTEPKRFYCCGSYIINILNLFPFHTGDTLVSYITPSGWGARHPGHMDPLTTPVDYVIITHTAQVTTPCYTTDECCMTVKAIQAFHMDEKRVY